MILLFGFLAFLSLTEWQISSESRRFISVFLKARPSTWTSCQLDRCMLHPFPVWRLETLQMELRQTGEIIKENLTSLNRIRFQTHAKIYTTICEGGYRQKCFVPRMKSNRKEVWMETWFTHNIVDIKWYIYAWRSVLVTVGSTLISPSAQTR